ncbi:MAG TPA: hypothetical protein HA362_04975 [Nanoarchaeota archaeon]|nr:hypothetical protein [Nanoarchaeota archaeon]
MKKEEAPNGFHFTWAMGLILVTVILLTVFVAYYFGFVKKSCQDDACFDSALQKCSMAVYPKVQNYNYYVYSIDGKSKGMCKIKIQLAKMAAGSPPDKIALFEGKGMDCMVPMEEISSVKSDKVESMLQYCTGPLKEAMYEQIIEKLYTIVVSNMGEILGDIGDTLRKK